MSRAAARFNIPDLDMLDSPLVSPTPISLSGIPGSALAERIFNDPESWEDNDDDMSDIPEDIDVSAEDEFEWLAEEIEKAVVVGTGGALHAATADSKAGELVPTPSASPYKNRKSWKGIGKRASVRPISLAALFEHSRDSFSGDIQQQISKIFDSSGIPYHTGPPKSSALSSSLSSSTSASTLDSPMPSTSTTATSTSASDLESQLASPSPVIVNSASATLSFLEWYGIYPDSPLRPPPKSARFRAPLLKLQVPSPRPAGAMVKPSPLMTPLSAGSDMTVVPVVPSAAAATTSTTANTDAKAKRASPAPPPGLEPPSNPAATAARRRTPSPPGLSRSPSPFRSTEHRTQLEGVQNQNQQRSESPGPARLNVTTERGRAMHMTAPPSYSREPSPSPAPGEPYSYSYSESQAQSQAVARSNSTTGVKMVDWRARSRSRTRDPSRDATPVRTGSVDLPIRRLPSIPPPLSQTSSASSSRPSTPPQGLGLGQPLPQPPVKGSQSQGQSEPQAQSQGQSAPQPPPRPSRTASPAPSLSHSSLSSSHSSSLSSTATPTNTTCSSTSTPSSTTTKTKTCSIRQSSRQSSADSRPASVRSPPMGPRTRNSRQSQDSIGSHSSAVVGHGGSGHGGRVVGPMGHRPPVLRL